MAGVQELAAVVVEIIRGRIEQGGPVEDPRIYHPPFGALVSWPVRDFLQQDTEDGRQPLDPALQSLCDAQQLPSRRMLRGLPRLPISCLDRFARKNAD